METLPPSIAKRIDASYQRPEKGNMIASLIRLIVFILSVQYLVVRPYMVPTGSMKNTIMENDFLLVNRFIYGLRTPDNISIPFTDTYFVRNLEPVRFTPELREIKSNDIVVFRADHEQPPVEYVKRAVAAAGDTIRMSKGQIYVNNHPFRDSENSIQPTALDIENDSIYGIRSRERAVQEIVFGGGFNFGIMRSSDFPIGKATREIARDILDSSLGFTATLKHDLIKNAELYKLLLNAIDVGKSRRRSGQERLFDQTYEESLLDATKMYMATRYFANIQNPHDFSAIYIPKKGDVLKFTEHHFDLLSNVVFYDGHVLDFNGETLTVDGVETTEYTVEQDYYFFIGDNRTGSLDSRAWGVVPRKYITGAPILIYFSVHQDAWKDQDLINAIFRTFKYINFDRIGQMLL
jgi:signal peptidase I